MSTAGSKLASAAAQRGSMIIDSASSAVQNARSPQKQQHHDTPTRKRSGAGIRDRINQFDSACRSTASPAPQRGTRVHVANHVNQSIPKSYPFNPNFRPDPINSEKKKNTQLNNNDTFDSLELQMEKENAVNNNFASPSKNMKQRLQQAFSPITERENTAQPAEATLFPGTLDGNKRVMRELDDENIKTFTSPSRHRKMKQKLQDAFSPVTERENAAKAIQKVKGVFSPVTNKREGTVQMVKETFLPSRTKNNKESASTKQTERGILLSPQSEVIIPAIDSSTSSSPIEKSDENLDLIRRLERLEKENQQLEAKNHSLEQKCRELINKNKRLEAVQTDAGENTKKMNNDNETKQKREAISKKRCSNEHPLIATPLRKHVHAVQEASETNSFISVRKEPFPLFPPSRGPVNEVVTGDSHLDELGILTGNNHHQSANRNAPSADDRNAREKRKNEEAMDLLNSAAFLFKTSRRKLN